MKRIIILGFVASPMVAGLEKIFILITFVYMLTRRFLNKNFSLFKVEKYVFFFFSFILVVILNFFIYWDFEILKNALPIFIVFVIINILYYRLSLADIKKSLFLLYIFNIFVIFDSFFQFLYGYDLCCGYQKMFGWKTTGPYPYTYIDTLSFVFIGVVLILKNFFYKKASILFNISIILNISLIILAGTRSSLLQFLWSLFMIYWISSSFYEKLKGLLYTFIMSYLFIFILNILSNSYDTIAQYLGRINKLLTFLLSLDLEYADIRYWIWKDFISTILEYPYLYFTGFGFGTIIKINNLIFQREFLIVDDIQNMWFDILYSSGLIGLIFFILFLFYFYKKFIKKTIIGKKIQLFLFFWWVSPFSVQHKLMDNWYVLNIMLSILLIMIIYKLNQRYKNEKENLNFF